MTPQEFETAYQEWKKHRASAAVRFSSDTAAGLDCPAVRKIVEGAPTRLLVEKLRQGDFFLNPVLAQIYELEQPPGFEDGMSEQAVSVLWLNYLDE